MEAFVFRKKVSGSGSCLCWIPQFFGKPVGTFYTDGFLHGKNTLGDTMFEFVIFS